MKPHRIDDRVQPLLRAHHLTQDLGNRIELGLVPPQLWPALIGSHRSHHLFGCGRHHGLLMHHGHWRLLAAPNARRLNDTHLGVAMEALHLGQQSFRPGQGTTQARAHAHGELGGLLAVAKHLKVVIESGDLIDLHHRELHPIGQGHKVRVAQAPFGILDAVQIFDELVTLGAQAFEK